MPSVYLTKMNAGLSIPSFKQKGIADQAPGVVGEVPVTIRASFVRTPIGLWRYIFHVMATGVLYGVDVVENFNIFRPITQLSCLFEVPPCSFRFNRLEPAEITEIKAMGMQQDLTNANLFVGSPPASSLARINALGPIDDRVRPGHLSHEAFTAWVYLMKGIQIFTAAKMNYRDDAFTTTASGILDFLEKDTKGSVVGISGNDIEFEKAPRNLLSKLGSFVLAPSHKRLSSFTGAILDIGRGHAFGEGIFFPFFSGMSLADKTTAYDVFSKIFQGCVAESDDSEDKIMDRIRKGVRQMSFSRTGLVMAHIYRCFDLSLQIPDAKVVVLVKGASYVGTLITGDYNLRMYGKLFKSGPVAGDIAAVDLLSSQCQEVCDLINSAESINGDTPYKFIKSDFLTSRLALRNYCTLDETYYQSTDTMDKIRTLLEKMEYNDTFLLPTQELILKAVSYMSTGNFSEISAYPAYLSSGALISKSKTWEALSMFGPRAPSCNYGDNKGNIFNLPSLQKEDINITKVNGVRPLHYFPFKSLPISVAVMQWDSMINKAMFSIPSGRKGKKEFTNLHDVAINVASDPAFTNLYTMIKGMANDARNAGLSGQKRKRSDNDDAGKGKSRRVDIETSDM